MESLGLSQKDAQSINGEGELRGQSANPGSPGKMAVKTECVRACVRVCAHFTCVSLSVC